MAHQAQASTGAPEVERLFIHYCLHSAKYWPERSQRQARKIEQRVRVLARASGGARGPALTSLVAAAKRRQTHRRRTVHLANIGSSGSHWLEHMLVEGAGMLGAGEVYLPPTIRQKVAELAQPDAGVFMDALTILHAGGVGTDESASVIHSMHAARPEAFLAADPSTLRVLLLRDPVDVCLSRVYRKDEYRQDIAPDSADMAYLEQNITKVAGFLQTAQGQVYDLVLRYEDLLRDPVPGMQAISALTGTQADRTRLEQVAEEQAAERISGKEAARATNLYVGEDRQVPVAARELVARRLGRLGAYFGYTQADG